MYFLHYTYCIESKNIMLREFLAADVQRIIGIRPIRAVQARWWNVGSRSWNAKGNAESDEQCRYTTLKQRGGYDERSKTICARLCLCTKS